MAKVYLIGINILILGLLAWGTGGCGGDNGVDPSISISHSDFEGDYQLRDENCVYENPINRFRLIKFTETVFSMTVLDPGDYEGDIFSGELIDGVTLDFGTGASMVRIVDEEEASNVAAQTNLDTKRGDLSVVNYDPASADDWCFLTYKPI